jgi:hypothetical protein
MSNDYELPPMPPLPYSGLGLYDYECDGEGGGFGVGYDNDDMERYAREYALLAVQRERERIESSAVVQYLYGADLLDGRGFGDGPPDGKPRYWWRSQLRATIRKG